MNDVASPEHAVPFIAPGPRRGVKTQLDSGDTLPIRDATQTNSWAMAIESRYLAKPRTIARAASVGALVGAFAFLMLFAVQLIKLGETGYAVPNMRTLPDGRRVLGFTWDLRLLNLPAMLFHRHTRLPWMRPQVLEYPHDPRPTRAGWSFAAWFTVGVCGFSAAFAMLGAAAGLLSRLARNCPKRLPIDE